MSRCEAELRIWAFFVLTANFNRKILHKFSKIIHNTRKGGIMRKEYVYISVLILCIVGVVWGLVGLINSKYNVEEAKMSDNVQNIYENKAAVTTAAEEKKVSPNTDFALKKFYDECSHFDYQEAELPAELVNMTAQEIEDYYEDWEIEEFTADKLVLVKEINGYCNQHFLIKLDDENVKVYRFDTNGELKEYKSTEISRDYLPQEDVENLEEGISVFGEGRLSSALEDFE